MPKKLSRVFGVAGALLIAASMAGSALGASHREAPLISMDAGADSTDLYAFRDPNDPTKVTIIADYIPMQDPAGGPNFWGFDPAVRYEIHIDNNRDAKPDVTYRFRFTTRVRNQNTFLNNTQQVTGPKDPDLNVYQTYSVTRIQRGRSTLLATNLPVGQVNVGARSNPSYADNTAVRSIRGSTTVFAGQRDDPFFADLGAIFDLGGLRPFNALHAIPLPAHDPVDDLQALNVHSIAIKVPITKLTKGARIWDASNPKATVGIWTAAYRQRVSVLNSNGTVSRSGSWIQVSRLGNPLVNEVIIPRGKKDLWNFSKPHKDSQFAKYYAAPELARIVNALYAAVDNADETGRSDLIAVLLTGLPGVNSTGSVRADMLRLNTGIAPCTADDPTDDSGACRRLGAFYDDAVDLAAWPNGRRLSDDVIDIAIRAVMQGYGAQLTTLFGPATGNDVRNRTPNNTLGDGVNKNDKLFLGVDGTHPMGVFPYVALPHSGYSHDHHAE